MLQHHCAKWLETTPDALQHHQKWQRAPHSSIGNYFNAIKHDSAAVTIDTNHFLLSQETYHHQSSGGVTPIIKPRRSSSWSRKPPSKQATHSYSLTSSFLGSIRCRLITGFQDERSRPKTTYPTNRRANTAHARTLTHTLAWLPVVHLISRSRAVCMFSYILCTCHVFLCLNVWKHSQWPPCQQASGSSAVTGCGPWGTQKHD